MNTIRRFLENSYFHPNAFDDELVYQIRACTENQGGHAAFASILWSPPVNHHHPNKKKNFYEYLTDLECDVLIVFGRDDPWCKPAFARKMLQALDQRHTDKVHRYVELANVGHCPNHEAPQAVAKVLSAWMDCVKEETTATEEDTNNPRQTVPLIQGEQEVISEQWGDIIAQERRTDDIPLSLVDRLATTFVG